MSIIYWYFPSTHHGIYFTLLTLFRVCNFRFQTTWCNDYCVYLLWHEDGLHTRWSQKML